MDAIAKLLDFHRKGFESTGGERVFACPGRINLIGEHIDYNGGFVLPAAIDKQVYLCVSVNNLREFRFRSEGFSETGRISFDDLYAGKLSASAWWVYAAGVIRLLEEDGWPMDTGLDLSFTSTIPVGAGMSSSAALTEVALYAVAQVCRRRVTGPHMALLGQRVERELAGVACGIMDQFAVVNGRANHAILLNTRDLTFRYVKIDSNEIKWVLVDSGAKHSLRESGYNDRRNDCETALEFFNDNGIDAEYLCEVSLEQYENYADRLTENQRKRAYHAITENGRSIEFYEMLKLKRYADAGKLLFASHHSLRDNFEVSTAELDQLVDWASEIPGVYGSRLMGGGFGGCTINMIAAAEVDGFVSAISKRFKEKWQQEPKVYICSIGDGVREISQ